MSKPLKKSKPLPRGMVARGRGFYYRRRRSGRDELVFLHSDLLLAEIEYHRRWLEDRTGIPARPVPVVDEQPEPKPEPMTVGAAATRWLERGIADRNERNRAMARARAARYLRKFMGSDALPSVTAERLLEYRKWLETEPSAKGTPLSRETQRHILADARCMFRWLEEHAYVARAPLPRRFLPKRHKVTPRWLSDKEVSRLLKELDGPWLFVVRLALATGMRWSEMCRAEAKHLSRDGQLDVPITKSGESRKVPLGDIDPKLAREISRRVGRLVPYKTNTVGTFNRRVKRKSKVSEFSCHRLRHTFATRWLARGGNIVALQKVLGHSDLELTQRYAYAAEEFVRAEARKVGALGWSKNGDETVTRRKRTAEVVAVSEG